MEGGSPGERAVTLLRSRLCDPSFIFSKTMDSPDSNYSKLKFIISSSITESCNNSILLLGPRGCGKNAVLELVLQDLQMEYPDMISLVKLNGLLHSDDNCALKEIAKQLCLEHQLIFSKMASFDDNSQFISAMLRECGLAHKTIIFVLDEFDLFTQGKQRLLYSLLDALQSLTSQAVVIGISCRLDADQLLEKRVRSRFSHRKLLFLPPNKGDLQRFVEHLLSLPEDSIFPRKYVIDFNSKLKKLLMDPKLIDVLTSLSNNDNSISYLTRFLFHSICSMHLEPGFLSLENFVAASRCVHRQPKLEILQDASVLELYILVCMNRLEVKEQNSYNFNSIMKEYKAVHDTYQTSDHYAHCVCLRAFEHLLEQELVGFVDGRVQTHSIDFRPVKLLISPQELNQGMRLNCSCPAMLLKLLDRETYK